MFPLSELRKQIHSMPRNPILSKLFRFARLSENAGYGIDKMLMWEQKRGKVDFTDDVVSSTIVFYLNKAEDTLRFSISDTQGGTQIEDLDTWIETQIRSKPNITTVNLSKMSGVSVRTIKRRIAGMPHIRFVGSGYSGHWEIIPSDQ